KKQKTRPAAAESAPTADIPAVALTPIPVQTAANPSGCRRASAGFTLRYIVRHMRRSAGKSILALALAALLLGTVGQFALIKQAYTQLCTDTVVKANFVGGLALGAVPDILKDGYVTDPYYELSETVGMNSAPIPLAITNDIARYTGEEIEINYADGYDASNLEKPGAFIVASAQFAEMYGLEPGGKVQLSSVGLLEKIRESYVGDYRDEHPDSALTDEEITGLLGEEITERFMSASDTFIIAGIVTTASGKYEDMAFTPGGYYYPSTLYGKLAELDVAEFTLADNLKADEFRAYAQQAPGMGATGRLTFIMDTSKLEYLLNSLRLLETLYPIAMTAALIIGGFLCCLVIVQSSKEAAIIRIQGTTKGKTRAILALEQVLLSIAGLIVGSAALLVYKGSALSVVSPQLALFAALYFAVILISAVICSSLATRRNVLELLQTKE
ncbi:MAG: ABC transporter permease, partial [Clostridiales bacterium]|nr:ABC transporter permease [Clostridiales bacterium]